MPPSSKSTLNPTQARDVLRYWLASVQLEEALAARPRARKSAAQIKSPRLEAPTAGQDYFKVPLDDVTLQLLRVQRALHKPLDAELCAYFETWLLSQYRRGADDREASHLLAFPVVHLPRGELAGLLKYSVRARFGIAHADEFAVPTTSERRRKQYPAPPDEVRITAAARAAQKWPFFVDTRLLHQQLGITRERIDEFFAQLRTEEELDEMRMLQLVTQLLEQELPTNSVATTPPSTVHGNNILTRIVSAMTRLLEQHAPRARVYPVGIVVDAARAKTTWYLQRELNALIDEEPEVAWDKDSCLGAYLTGASALPGRSVQRTLFRGTSLTDSQRDAAEYTWGSRLAAVQGPPGTGKTTLILHLATQALAQQVDALVDAGEMGRGLFVVTSTNNRAVDNVIDALNDSETGLPLALRAGSQRVCEQVLSGQLQRTHAWLSAQLTRPVGVRARALEAALDHYKSVRSQMEAALRTHAADCNAYNERQRLQAELSRLSALISENTAAASALDTTTASALHEPLQRAQRGVQVLCELCEKTPGLAELTAVDRQYKRLAKQTLPELQETITAAGLTLDLNLPPALPPSTDPAVLMEVWSEAAAAALEHIEALQVELARAMGEKRNRERVQMLSRQLGDLPLGNTAAQPPDPAQQHALFEAVVSVREAWAALHSERLSNLVQRATAAAAVECSMKPLWDNKAGAFQELCQLFSVWGCTLLSLGNCFPARADSIAQAVIDEAGQCHPTYAVSALMRSRSALIIGDVHQLEPVIELEMSDDERVISSAQLTLSAQELAPYRVNSDVHNSVQALADRAVIERPRLIDHFRCQPEIIAICDALCGYGLRVHTAHRAPNAALPFLPHPVSLLDIHGEQERLGGSWHNAAELAATLELLQVLFTAGVDPADVALITPYRGQLELLHKQLARMHVPLEFSLELLDAEQPRERTRGLALGTVHRFQGGERSIVLFSSVVTRRASLTFLDQRENLLNVAVSRAQHRFIAIGQRALLAQGQRTHRLVEAAAPLQAEDYRLQLSLGT